MASAGHDMIADDDGTREQKAEWWIEALLACMDQVDPDYPGRRPGGGRFRDSSMVLWPWTTSGMPLYKVKLWCDTSPRPVNALR
jgi:xylulokinase